MNNKRFTLIELIVVIAILGILASLIVPNISSFKGDATVTAIASNVRNFQTSVDMYSLKNNGQYPTIEQPTEFIPQPIDFTKLDKTYLKTLPKTDGVKYWVDFQGRVWASTVDAPQKVTNTNGTITWEAVAGAAKYQVFEVQGYGGVIGTLSSSKSNLLLKGETDLTTYVGETNKYYVVNAIDEKNFQTAPAGLNYKGYVLPVTNPTEEEEQPTIPQNIEPQPIQTIVPDGYTGIYTLEDLNNVRNNLSGKYILMKNLDFNKDADYTNIADKTTWTTGTGWTPIGTSSTPFTGTFDGNGLSISNLYINRTSYYGYNGLFGYTGNISIVKNISLVNANVTGGTYTGILVGYLKGQVTNIYTSGSVAGSSYVGGLIGNTDINGIEISKLVSSVNVNATGDCVGGLIGNLSGPNSTLINSYATGSVKGSRYVGGLVGQQVINITNSYSTGTVTNINNFSEIGGLVGYKYSGTTTNSYWNAEISTRETSNGGTQLNTNSMFIQEKFIGFDFANIWNIQEGQTMPYLRGLFIPDNIKKVNLTGKYIEYAGGKGTVSEPYLISNEQQLNNIRNEKQSHYKLTNNIVLTAYQTGNGWTPIGSSSAPFTGTFDGNRLSISNLYVNRTTSFSHNGLFGYTGNTSIIKDISLTNANVTGGTYTGTLIGNSKGKVTNVSTSGSVSGTSYVGGLIGNTEGNGVETSKLVSSVNVSATGDSVGGLIGNLSGPNSTLINSYATGSVKGNRYVGGLVGQQVINITNSYSTGTVTTTNGSSYIGGLVGYKYSGTTTNSYWNTETSGRLTNQGGSGKTTMQMKQQATYIGWDFTNTWTINEGNDYPKLK